MNSTPTDSSPTWPQVFLSAPCSMPSHPPHSPQRVTTAYPRSRNKFRSETLHGGTPIRPPLSRFTSSHPGRLSRPARRLAVARRNDVRRTAPPWASSDSALTRWRGHQGPRCARQIHRCPVTVHAWRTDATDCRRGTVLLRSAPHSRRLCIPSPSIAFCIHTSCPMMHQHHHCSPLRVLSSQRNGILNTWTPFCVGRSPPLGGFAPSGRRMAPTPEGTFFLVLLGTTRAPLGHDVQPLRNHLALALNNS
ncbi:hypothetical protein C8T65DRAFT_142518 [Cerioporus squamosus]|nr:hypothetical protein C8T65DRAFT_142518 [Cerioporus squamosus]